MVVTGYFRSSQTKPPDINQLINIKTKIFTDDKPPIWDEINLLGEDGWEMVNAFPSEWDGSTYNVVFMFKRQKKDN